ncbi:MAG: aromatic ring-hydroxylating dioxygenase subunit alpha [Verrucomicrobiales bacterium]|nr:aromatic ring-hydroxylating dioxygenase subunit alpha [Verrucomicrobiales bacterium]
MTCSQDRIDSVQGRIGELIAAHRPGWTLQQPFYTDPAIFDLELEKIFLRSWLFAGHVSQIPRRGDYFLYEIARESMIIIRGDKDHVHALVNVCRHRGSRVCVEPSGHAQSLVCPYHNWVYALDGALQSARLMPENFDKSQFGLRRAQAQVVEGLIFISLAEEPPRLAAALGDIQPHLEPYQLAQARICHSEDHDLPANWKLLNENFRECYHCRANHPELCQLMPHISLESPQALEEFENWAELSQNRWRNKGLTAPNIPISAENGHHVMRFPFKKGYVSQTMDGQLAAPLLGRFTDPDAGIVAGSILPTFWLELSVDYAMLMQITPSSPTVTRIHLDFLVRGDAVEGVDFELERLTRFWRLTLEQDYKLCEISQAGVSSRHYTPGPYAPGITAKSSLGEKGPQAFIAWYLNQLASA